MRNIDAAKVGVGHGCAEVASSGRLEVCLFGGLFISTWHCSSLTENMRNSKIALESEEEVGRGIFFF